METLITLVQNNPFIAVSVFLGLVSAVAVIGWIRASLINARLSAEQQGREEQLLHFKSVAEEALKASHENFLTLAQERFRGWQIQAGGDMEKREKAIADMVKPVDDQLKSIKTVMEQMKGTDEGLRTELKSLSSETARIAGAMKNPAQRGQWGEYILDRLLEKSGLIRGVHYDTQVTMEGAQGQTQRPDVVIQMQEGLQIIIDSKAPIQDVLADLDDPETALAARDQLARQLREHIKALSKREYGGVNDDSPDFVVLFLPGEHLYSTALSADPGLIDFAAENNIVLASPMLMLALARVVHMGWRQFELGKHARDIANEAAELHGRINSFMGHYHGLGKSLKGAVDKYNQSVGSMERMVMPKLRKMEEMQVVQPGKEISDTPSIEVVPKTGTDE